MVRGICFATPFHVVGVCLSVLAVGSTGPADTRISFAGTVYALDV